MEWQNFTPESFKETSLLGDRWLGGSTTQFQPALKQFLNVAWTARQAKINQAVAPEQDDPTGELSSAIDGPSRTLALNLPAQAVRRGEPNPMARPALLDPSSTGHSGTTALDGMTALHITPTHAAPAYAPTARRQAPLSTTVSAPTCASPPPHAQPPAHPQSWGLGLTKIKLDPRPLLPPFLMGAWPMARMLRHKNNPIYIYMPGL